MQNARCTHGEHFRATIYSVHFARETTVLTTQQEHELPLFPFSTGSGVTTWRAVTLHLGTPYTFVNYAIRQGRAWLSQTTIFWRHEDVLNFCRATNKDKKRKIIDVFMLAPTTHELSHKWSFVSIREILIWEDEEEDEEFPIYVTVDGEVVGGIGFVPYEEAPSYDAYKGLKRVFCADSDISSTK